MPPEFHLAGQLSRDGREVTASEVTASRRKILVAAGVRSKLRGPDLNRRPRGYEPRELPGCSTPRQVLPDDTTRVRAGWFIRFYRYSAPRRGERRPRRANWRPSFIVRGGLPV